MTCLIASAYSFLSLVTCSLFREQNRFPLFFSIDRWQTQRREDCSSIFFILQTCLCGSCSYISYSSYSYYHHWWLCFVSSGVEGHFNLYAFIYSTHHAQVIKFVLIAYSVITSWKKKLFIYQFVSNFNRYKVSDLKKIGYYDTMLIICDFQINCISIKMLRVNR